MGQLSGVDFSRVGIITFLLPDIVDGAVAGVGVFVDLTVADALETARAGQSGPKAANPREHVKVTNQMVSASFVLQGRQKAEDAVVYRAPGFRLPALFCF